MLLRKTCSDVGDQLSLYCGHFYVCFSCFKSIAVINYQQTGIKMCLPSSAASNAPQKPPQTVRQTSSQCWHQTQLIGRVFDFYWRTLTVKVVF